MPRTVRLAAAQMGTTNKWSSREETLNRMILLLKDAATQGAKLVLFPEIAFTTFFPRYLILDEAEIEDWFEHGDILTAPRTKALFDTAHDLAVDIIVGFAEATDTGEHFNSCVYYHAATGSILSRYRKVHLPGDVEPLPDPKAVNQLEKRYFKPGNLGFQAFRVPGLLSPSLSHHQEGEKDADPILGMMICNDRRWAESWREYGLQGVEIVACGYNTNGYAPQFWGQSTDMTPKEAEELSLFHHKLVMQCHSYTNACFSVSAARCGLDDGEYPLIAGSSIVDPEGRIIAEANTKGDEVIIADCDLGLCRAGKTRTFDFARHRRVEHYGRITGQTGVVEPPSTTSSNIIVPKTEEKGKIRVLLINPNSTPSMTDTCISMVKPTLPPDVEVVPFTAPIPAPSAIEGSLDAVLSAAAAVRAILPIADQYDAFLVACFSDHPLVYALREELSVPVIGIMEAGLMAARTVGGRFGVVVTSQRSKVIHADAVRKFGMDRVCAGVEACGMGVLELDKGGADGRKDVVGAMCGAAKRLVDGAGADVIVLGCAGMMKLKKAVEEAVGGDGDVQVVDGVVAGVQHLVGLVRMGVKTAKKGVYASSKVGRLARGQEYL
ncbi:carbon-nitrogen hydrolase [Aspergillus eucalypticola CBS 122712]|uniref:Carbon-nitrogen hydrolase n=1 Tax=Aspergillus eucalypticola (strain CBS 122712 / IBT 29274) TaxID=1448314 RepID=A0A317UTV3_ASPEC|nr:carbon-nitrogen hydrolase [Aspergillus eucalypticola CBS 122712]PWY65464.1 carbon-nitrogen hydrolase [Aspergillus eucalypticola CBS 122712]